MTTKTKIFLVIILLIAAILRFYNLTHDAPYFFNPDERNMANAITLFKLPNQLVEIPECILSQFRISDFGFRISECNLNPHFFAYGQFPLYLAYFSDQAVSVMLNSFQHPVEIPKQVRDDNLST